MYMWQNHPIVLPQWLVAPLNIDFHSIWKLFQVSAKPTTAVPLLLHIKLGDLRADVLIATSGRWPDSICLEAHLS